MSRVYFRNNDHHDQNREKLDVHPGTGQSRIEDYPRHTSQLDINPHHGPQVHQR